VLTPIENHLRLDEDPNEWILGPEHPNPHYLRTPQ